MVNTGSSTLPNYHDLIPTHTYTQSLKSIKIPSPIIYMSIYTLMHTYKQIHMPG